jgi:hypothetical protein
MPAWVWRKGERVRRTKTGGAKVGTQGPLPPLFYAPEAMPVAKEKATKTESNLRRDGTGL